MQTEFRKRGGECSQLLDLISMEGWLKSDGGGMSFGASEEKKLELTLAPPGGEGWPAVEDEPEKQTFNFSSSCFTKIPKSFDENAFVGAEMGFADAAEPESEGFRKEQSHGSRMHTSSEKGALLRSSNQMRATSAPVVGWPPIRSFRKNIAIATTKQSDELSNGARENGETSKKGLFVKINMDGIPIGRKVDLNAHDSYQKLSSTVEELFSGLLAAQRDPAASGNGVSENDRMAFTGLLDGSGEYTLVYEDNEGDRMMVGDVPWDMFVSTAKRLRVLKNSELSALFMGAVNRKKAAEP